MARIKIYTDEDVNVAIAEGLKRRDVSAWSARDAGNLGLEDEAQLIYACSEQACILTHDDDFLRLTARWVEEGKQHWGIIYARQYRLSIGECIRRIKLLVDVLSAEEMENHIEFL